MIPFVSIKLHAEMVGVRIYLMMLERLKVNPIKFDLPSPALSPSSDS